MCTALFNPCCQRRPQWETQLVSAFLRTDIADCHRSFLEYRPTPMPSLPDLAAELGLGDIYVKDESFRFGLKAFKVLGASYAVYRFLKQRWDDEQAVSFDIRRFFDDPPDSRLSGQFTFCTATDGNHGRAVAFTARRLSQKAVVYMPNGSARARIEAIHSENAEVHIVDGTYDDAVCVAAEQAEQNGWQVIADTAYPGYMTIPADIMAGYTTMMGEMETRLHRPDDPGVDFVFLQAGVGSFAAAAIWYYVNRYGENRPRLIIVEPTEAACLFDSIRSPAGEITTARGNFQTIMAGLNCGTPSLLAWPFIKTGADLFLAISDGWTEEAMKTYYSPRGNDPRIISGESGSAGLAALLALMQSGNLKEAKEKLGLGRRSRILIINTEGDTDPDGFEAIISNR